MKRSFLIKVLGLTMALSLTMVGVAFATNAANVPGGTLTSTFVNGDAANDFGTYGTTAGNDNGMVNANMTGAGTSGQNVRTPSAVIAKPTQRTHGEYQNNTNSCASCHQTHTAAATNLLFKDGVYTTCTACHDGTLGVLNVFTGSSAGTFGGTIDGGASMHLPTGALQMSAAPGGNHTPVVAGKEGTGWDAEFTCASCHSPHGSYSDRLLNYNPNNIAATPYYFQTVAGAYTDNAGTLTSGNAGDLSATTTAAIKSGGLQATGPFTTTIPATVDALSPDFLIYKTTSDSATLGTDTIPVGVADLNNNMEPAGTAVIVVMKKVRDIDTLAYSYVRDMTPWVNDSASASRATQTWFASNADNDIASHKIETGITIALGYGYAKNTVKETVVADATDILNKVKFNNIARAVVVKLNLESYTPVAVTFNGVEVKRVDQTSYGAPGFGVPVSRFCASCHTDYFAISGSEIAGVWSTAFRHTTNTDSFTCLKCHFAHGTDVTVMLDTNDQNLAQTKIAYEAQVPATYTDNAAADAAAKAYLLDTNESSVLKRYTGMAVCWKCHSTSGDLINVPPS